MDSHDNQDLPCKINLLNEIKQNQEFLKQLRNTLEHLNLVDLTDIEKRIFKNVLPAISNRFTRVYDDNISLFEMLNDEIISVLIKENLEVAFELTEALQEILNFTYQLNSINAADIESILKYVPNCVLLFADHWKNSSVSYKNAFNEEISKLVEVIKHLYVSFLHILEFSVMYDNNDELGLLVQTLTLICEPPKHLHSLDASFVISSWKCFGAVSAKYATQLETCIDMELPINALCEDIYKVLQIILNHDMDAFPQHIKMINLLIKVLFKITDTFYQQLDTFSLNLLIFYIKVLSLPLDHFKRQEFSTEALLALDADVFKCLDVFLQHLVMGKPDLKNHLEKILDYIKNMNIFKEHPLGVIHLLCKILHMVTMVDSDWCLITVRFVEAIFVILPLCHVELVMDSNCDGIYQQLIINMSAAILLQDVRFESAENLLRYILQDDVFVAVLALEVYTLVVSNLHPEECLTLSINLLYGVNDLLCGFFTSRPEIIYLKKLVQRIFTSLPNTLKGEIIKLFKPDQCIQIWRFLGFNNLPAHQVQLLINPIVSNTSECIKSIEDNFSQDTLLNISEGLYLLSTVDNLDINDPMFGEITKFLDIFWKSDFNCNAMLDNNIMNYFILKITGITSSCIESSILDLQIISTKLKTLSCKEQYWVPVYKLICSILYSIASLNIPEINKQRILTQIAETINLPIQNKVNHLLRETYLELFMNLNESQKDVLNLLLDALNPNVAGQIFQYLKNYSPQTPLIMDHKQAVFFKHNCINWKAVVNTSTVLPQLKRAKMEIPLSEPVKTPDSIISVFTGKVSDKTKKISNNEKTKEQKGDSSTFSCYNEEDDSAAAEVIERIRGEVKCLLKVCKTEKLTKKNVADLRILMSQLSSLM